MRTYLSHVIMGDATTLVMDVTMAQTSYQIAIVPQFTAVEIHKSWQPLIDKITELSGVSLSLVAYPNIPSFEQGFKQGEADFVYMNPYHMVMAYDAQGYLPMVRDVALLNGILVVRKDSGIAQIADLAGKTIAFPAPNAFGASLWMRAQLTKTHSVTFEESYVGSHQTVYRQVLTGDVAAGGGIQSTLNKESANIRDELNILYQTPDVPSHPIAYHPRVNLAVANKVRDAFLTLSQDSQGQGLLKAVQWTKPVVTEYEQEYLPLKALKLETFVK